MTLEQLSSLDEKELEMALYIVNVLNPIKPEMEIPPRGLTWFKKGVLEKILIDSFNQVKPEYHPIYSSLLNKLNIEHNITYNAPPTGSL